MKDDIIEKLKKYSYEYPREEADIVYIIIQTGKIIESQKAENDFPALSFYRNWVVHYQLDRHANDDRKKMFDKLNEAILTMILDKNPRFSEAISFSRLNKEIASFFKSNNLEKPRFDYLPWFKKFDELLVSVLIDLPLLPPRDSGYAFTEFRFNNKSGEKHDLGFEIKLADNISIGGKVVVQVNGRANLS